jgi:hypothetical protein
LLDLHQSLGGLEQAQLRPLLADDGVHGSDPPVRFSWGYLASFERSRYPPALGNQILKSRLDLLNGLTVRLVDNH